MQYVWWDRHISTGMQVEVDLKVDSDHNAAPLGSLIMAPLLAGTTWEFHLISTLALSELVNATTCTFSGARLTCIKGRITW
jgi:hypothetical protein